MKKIFLSCNLFFIGYNVLAQLSPLDYANKLTQTIMRQYADSMVVKKYASHLEQDKLIQAGQTAEQAQQSRPANWNYELGVVLTGIEKLGNLENNKTYLDYSKKMIDQFILPDGTIRTYIFDEYNSDNVPTGRQLLHLYSLTKEEKYKIAATTLYNQVQWQPRNKAGGFWHKLKYPTQMWLDGLYMLQPFATEYAKMFNDNERFDEVVNQFVLMEKYGRDATTGLLYHGWDESRLQKWANKKTGQSPEFWSRAMGWYMMALVDVLDYLPSNYKKRNELIAILNRTTKALIKYQDENEGVWWQVTNKANQPKNYLESSSSAMFIYAMAKGINKGYLSKNYLPNIKKGFDGIIKNFVKVDDKGIVHYMQAVAGAGLGGTPYRDGTYEYYVNEPKRDDDLKAIGPFIQACIEYNVLTKK